jgi:hypothetical protein
VSAQVKEVARWRDRYRADYVPVGLVVGRYYGADGVPTPAVATVARALEAAAAQDAAAARECAALPGCNSRWSQGVGGEVWCDDDPVTGRPRLPRHMFSSVQQQKLCVCVTADSLAETAAPTADGSGAGRFALLPHCDAAALRCTTPP